MKKNYVKMNDMKILSLGNLCNIVKEESVNKKNFIQSDIFGAIFGTNDVNSTTINNYLVGIRAIGIEYKNIFEEKYNRYLNNYDEFVDVIGYILNILYDEVIVLNNTGCIHYINKDNKFKNVITRLYDLCLIDSNIGVEYKSKLKKLILKSNLYESFVIFLKYIILENKQPLLCNSLKVVINKEELDEYLKVKLHFGESYISSLLYLHNKGNMYASSELGSLEFDGLITGKSDYNKCFLYYKTAADAGCPKGCFMVAHLMLSDKVKFDFDIMWEYLNKAIKLDSAAAYNTLGKCYLRGNVPDRKKDITEAKKYFKISSDYGYTFAFNNLGMLCEKEGNNLKAFDYYKISADMGNSWALNKIGEYYRKNGDINMAYICYNKAINAPYKEVCKWAYYNLYNYYKDRISEEIIKEYYKYFK